jgi:hypothetical protein
MLTRIKSVAAMAALIALAACSQQPTAEQIQAAKNAQKALDIAAVQNLMGLYSNYAYSNEYGKLPDLFALKTDGVRYSVPMAITGSEAIKAELLRRQSDHDAGKDPVGMMHIHPMSTPVIEIAGDGKTAKGVWDSFGPDIASSDELGNWLYVKKAVDFVKEDGVWKIWHMQDYPVFNTPYNKSITQSAKEGFNERRGPPPSDAMPSSSADGMNTDMSSMPPPSNMSQGMEGTAPQNIWIYDGKTFPVGPKMPVPYETWNPADSY